MNAHVLVAMSGGVDSSVAAALLLEQGFAVRGVTMRLWRRSRCCDEKDIEDAWRVAEHLGIPFQVLDYQEAFRAAVVDDFLAEYQAGRTPNPCVRCNQYLKFDALLGHADRTGARFVATGHYVRRTEGPEHLLKGIDPHKDQSYFLFATPRTALPRLLFPVGGMEKAEVRAKAAQVGLPVAEKGESQDVCFVPGGDYGTFLREQLGPEFAKEGEIVDEAGRVIGRHAGTAYFTVGQRRGLGLSADKPLYVKAVLSQANRLLVSEENGLYTREAVIEGINWLEDPGPERDMSVDVKLRYRSPAVPAVLASLGNGRARLHFATAQRAVTPGQGAACYRGDVLLGGGWIASASPEC